MIARRAPMSDQDLQPTVSRTSRHDACAMGCRRARASCPATLGDNRPLGRGGRRRGRIQICMRVAAAFRRNRGNKSTPIPAYLLSRPEGRPIRNRDSFAKKPAPDENEDQAPMKALARRLRRLRRDSYRQTSRKRRRGFASLPEHLINMNRRRICKNTSITSRSRCGALTDILWACCRIRGRAKNRTLRPSSRLLRAADRYLGCSNLKQ